MLVHFDLPGGSPIHILLDSRFRINPRADNQPHQNPRRRFEFSFGQTNMTIDKSLKIRSGSSKQRNVLTRPERLAKLIETERWQEGDPVLGLPKVRVIKISLKKKKKVKKVDEEEETGRPAAAQRRPAGTDKCVHAG